MTSYYNFNTKKVESREPRGSLYAEIQHLPNLSLKKPISCTGFLDNNNNVVVAIFKNSKSNYTVTQLNYRAQSSSQRTSVGVFLADRFFFIICNTSIYDRIIIRLLKLIAEEQQPMGATVEVDLLELISGYSSLNLYLSHRKGEKTHHLTCCNSAGRIVSLGKVHLSKSTAKDWHKQVNYALDLFVAKDSLGRPFLYQEKEGTFYRHLGNHVQAVRVPSTITSSEQLNYSLVFLNHLYANFKITTNDFKRLFETASFSYQLSEVLKAANIKESSFHRMMYNFSAAMQLTLDSKVTPSFCSDVLLLFTDKIPSEWMLFFLTLIGVADSYIYLGKEPKI